MQTGVRKRTVDVTLSYTGKRIYAIKKGGEPENNFTGVLESPGRFLNP
jgi:hypothetical protein